MEIGKSILCRRANSERLTDMTAPLPAGRVTKVEPCKTIGMSFSGLFYVRSRSSTQKVYLVLVTSVVIMAVRLELVPDMTTSSFLVNMRKFVSLGGVPRVVYMNNSSTFNLRKKKESGGLLVHHQKRRSAESFFKPLS